MRVAHRHPLDVGVGIRIEHIALRVGTEQRLRLVLAMQVHEQRADLGEHADGGRRAVHPGARLPFAQHFALQDESSVFQFDTKGGEGRQKMAVNGGNEFKRAFDDRFVGAGTDDVSRGSLAEQERQCIDEHRFPGTRFAGEDVEARLKRESDVGNDGEIADS